MAVLQSDLNRLFVLGRCHVETCIEASRGHTAIDSNMSLEILQSLNVNLTIKNFQVVF